MLALLCVVGMFSIPFGENIKVSLQLMMVMIIVLTAESVIDCLIITTSYLVLGLFLPIYAGFSTGVSPTFGYVISFVLVCPILYFLNKIPKIHPIPRMIMSCVASLLFVYAVGTVFMMAYLSKWDLGAILLVSVVPYIPFDIVKIALVITIIQLLPPFITHQPKKKGDKAHDQVQNNSVEEQQNEESH